MTRSKLLAVREAPKTTCPITTPPNYLFVGSEAGGKAAAIAYTLIETAKLNAVDPHAWLADTLARIPDYKITKVDDLLPWQWNG